MAETVSQAVVFLNHFRDLPDPRQTGKALYPLEEVVLLSRLRGLGVRRNTAVRGLKVQQKCREGSCRKRPISVETVRQYVAENRLTEPDGLLLRAVQSLGRFG